MFRLVFARAARKDLESLPPKMQDRILAEIEKLRENARPSKSKKLKGMSDTYRIRVGDYRVLYEIHEREVVVLVVGIRHRKDAYR